jgi:hypothetical protein
LPLRKLKEISIIDWKKKSLIYFSDADLYTYIYYYNYSIYCCYAKSQKPKKLVISLSKPLYPHPNVSFCNMYYFVSSLNYVKI